MVNKLTNHIHRDDIFKNIDLSDVTEIFQNMKASKTYSAWQPGLLLTLLLTVILGVMEAISQGEWFPGMVFGALILYLILVWLVIFGESVPSS
jgi:hypothetical protein